MEDEEISPGEFLVFAGMVGTATSVAVILFLFGMRILETYGGYAFWGYVGAISIVVTGLGIVIAEEEDHER